MRFHWAVCLLLLVPLAAKAGVTLTAELPGVETSQVAGVTTENFDTDGISAGSYTNLVTAVGTFTAPSPGLAIAPADKFGGAGGTGNYFVVGAQSGQLQATLALPGAEAYMGLWLSALDDNNLIQLYSGATLVATYNPAAVLTLVSGNSAYFGNPNAAFLGQDGSEPFVYLNFIGTSGTTFDKVVFSNASLASGLEIDNISIDATAPNPTPGIPVPGGTDTPLPSAAGMGILAMLLAGGALAMRKRAVC